jgi:hypothetical protein
LVLFIFLLHIPLENLKQEHQCFHQLGPQIYPYFKLLSWKQVLITIRHHCLFDSTVLQTQHMLNWIKSLLKHFHVFPPYSITLSFIQSSKTEPRTILSFSYFLIFHQSQYPNFRPLVPPTLFQAYISIVASLIQILIFSYIDCFIYSN